MTSERATIGIATSVMAFFAPISPLIFCAITFVFIDFVVGCMAGYRRAMRQHRNWVFSSGRAWDTIMKLFFIMVGIVMAWMIDCYILDYLHLNLAKLFTGFVCGVEFVSFLENAAEISNHPVFRWLRKFIGKKFKDSGIDIDGAQEEEKGSE